MSDESTGASRTPAGPGDVLGRYLVLDKLGAGGMGVVYAAYDPELDRKLAIKLLRPIGGDSGASTARGRLLREAQALAQLSHPCVVAVHDVGVVDEQVFVAMEFVEGRTLGEWVAERPRSWREIRDIFHAAGRGLLAAHDAGLIHRDFKPDNVMVSSDGRVRVMDFGLARADDAAATESVREEVVDAMSDQTGGAGRGILATPLTRAGSVMGTPAYMSPEQHLGMPTDGRTDQFSFCVALYEALYGVRPFPGETLAALAFNVCEGRLAAPPSRSAVPGWLRRIVLRGLAVDLAERWPSMRELLVAVQREPGRRRMAVGALVIVAAGLVAVPVIERARARAVERACGEAAAEIDQVWSAERRAAVAGHFEALEATRYFDRAAASLEAWIEDWRSVAESTCISAPPGEARTEQQQAANACLDDRRDALEVFVNTMQGVDAANAHAVVLMSLGLPRTADCIDDDWLRRWPRPSDDPAVQAQVRGARSRIRTAHSLADMGRLDEARTVAEQASAEAQDVDWPPIAIEADLGLGRILAELGHHDEGAVLMRETFWRAGALGLDGTAARAATELTWVFGVDEHDAQAGRLWARLAEMMLQRQGREGSADTARLEITKGAMFGEEGVYDEAQVSLERALEIYDRELGPDSPQAATAHNNLGTVLEERGELRASLDAHLRALEIRERTLGPDHVDVASSFFNVATERWRLGEAERGLQDIERALEIARATLGGEHPDVARNLDLRGVLLAQLGRTEEAVAAHEQAIRIIEARLGPDSSDLLGPTMNLGVRAQESGDYAAAQVSFERALELAERVYGPDHPATATALENLALVLGGQERREEAIALLNRALVVRRRTQGERSFDIAWDLSTLAELMAGDGRAREALGLAEAAARMYEEVDAAPTDVAAARFGLATIRWELGDDPAARVAEARSERQACVGLGSACVDVLSEMDAWLAERDSLRP